MQTNMLTKTDAFDIAQELRSEQGENHEYDRALIEFLSDAFWWYKKPSRCTIDD